MNVYSSEIQVVEVKQIPEDGDQLFSLGNPNYPKLVVNGEVSVDYKGVGALSHQPTAKSGIGVLENGNTILVEVSEPGVTVKQLANIFVGLQAKHAAYTGSLGLIATYQDVQTNGLGSDPAPEEVMVAEDDVPAAKQTKAKKK